MQMLWAHVVINLNQSTNMPVMLRKKGKAQRIALSILGVPQNRSHQKVTKKEKRNEQQLLFEDTQRVR